MLATATAAEAQTWLSDRKRAEGSGIRLGDLELHPGLGAEFGYISNVYNAEPDEELPSAALRIAPHLFLSTLSEERADVEAWQKPGFIAFRGGLSALLQHYFADGAPETSFGTDINLALTFAPERPISFTVTEAFSRSFQPFADPVNEPAATDDEIEPGDPVEDAPRADFVRYQNSLGARLQGQTNGGLLQGGLGYRLFNSWFDDEAYASNNSLTHTVDLTGAWEFFPKSALFYDVAYSHQNYTNNAATEGLETRQRLEDNDQIAGRLGFNGAISARISATLAAGYAVGFFGGNDFEGLTLNAEGRWTPTKISELALGYERAFSSAYVGNFVLRNQIYSRCRFFVGGAFVITSKLAVEFLDFGPDELQSDEARSDIRYSGDLSAEYRFVSWLAVTGQLSAIIDETDFVARSEFLGADGDTVEVVDPAEFRTFEAWFGVRAFY